MGVSAWGRSSHSSAFFSWVLKRWSECLSSLGVMCMANQGGLGRSKGCLSYFGEEQKDRDGS